MNPASPPLLATLRSPSHDSHLIRQSGLHPAHQAPSESGMPSIYFTSIGPFPHRTHHPARALQEYILYISISPVYYILFSSRISLSITHILQYPCLVATVS
jgi:hypothetical protein